MKRNLLILGLIVGIACNLIPFAPPEAHAQQGPEWFIRSQVGATATLSQLESGEPPSTIASVGFMRLVLPANEQIAIGGSYTDLNNQGENWKDWQGKIYLFTRSVRSNAKPLGSTPLRFWDQSKTQLYLTLGPGWADNEKKGEAGNLSFNSGIGLLFPVLGTNPYIEFGGMYMKKWTLTLAMGLQVGLY